MLPNHNPTSTAAWQKLEVLFLTLQASHIKELFEEDDQRFEKFHLQFEDILVDYSKNIIHDEVMRQLVTLAKEVELKSAIEAMFTGEKINRTENRAVLHTALRNKSNNEVKVDNEDVMPEVNRVLQQMKTFSDNLLNGTW